MGYTRDALAFNFLDSCCWSVFHDRLNPIIAAAFRLVILTGTDDLVIGCSYIKPEHTCGCGILDKAFCVSRIFLYGFDAIHAGTFAGITFAAEDDLAVVGFQAETKFFFLSALVNFKFSHDFIFLMMSDLRLAIN